jgi:hypothetical protein
MNSYQLNLFNKNEEVDSKICPKCLKDKPLEEFRKRQKSENSSTTRIYTNCKQCEREINKLIIDLKKDNPKINNTCDCCGKKTRLYLDHCHITKKFRGWLCNNCNVGLSRLGDDIDGLVTTMNYLMKHRNTYKNEHI